MLEAQETLNEFLTGRPEADLAPPEGPVVMPVDSAYGAIPIRPMA
jgi:hypothetical protein